MSIVNKQEVKEILDRANLTKSVSPNSPASILLELWYYFDTKVFAQSPKEKKYYISVDYDGDIDKLVTKINKKIKSIVKGHISDPDLLEKYLKGDNKRESFEVTFVNYTIKNERLSFNAFSNDGRRNNYKHEDWTQWYVSPAEILNIAKETEQQNIKNKIKTIYSNSEKPLQDQLHKAKESKVTKESYSIGIGEIDKKNNTIKKLNINNNELIINYSENKESNDLLIEDQASTLLNDALKQIPKKEIDDLILNYDKKVLQNKDIFLTLDNDFINIPYQTSKNKLSKKITKDDLLNINQSVSKVLPRNSVIEFIKNTNNDVAVFKFQKFSQDPKTNQRVKHNTRSKSDYVFILFEFFDLSETIEKTIFDTLNDEHIGIPEKEKSYVELRLCGFGKNGNYKKFDKDYAILEGINKEFFTLKDEVYKSINDSLIETDNSNIEYDIDFRTSGSLDSNKKVLNLYYQQELTKLYQNDPAKYKRYFNIEPNDIYIDDAYYAEDYYQEEPIISYMSKSKREALLKKLETVPPTIVKPINQVKNKELKQTLTELTKLKDQVEPRLNQLDELAKLNDDHKVKQMYASGNALNLVGDYQKELELHQKKYDILVELREIFKPEEIQPLLKSVFEIDGAGGESSGAWIKWINETINTIKIHHSTINMDLVREPDEQEASPKKKKPISR